MGDFQTETQSTAESGLGNKKDRPERPLDRGRVLLVEDEKDLRECLALVFRNYGFRVSCAGNGREALRLLRSERAPDLIVLDLNLPEMDGWELRAIQKSDPRLGAIPVLVISADASPQAAAISAQGYLRKPFDGKEIMVAVDRVLAEQALRQSAPLSDTESLASLGRLAANVGHEINNPLAFVSLNLRQSLVELQSSLRCFEEATAGTLTVAEAQTVKANLVCITSMLQDCDDGAERIRETIVNLQQLSQKGAAQHGPLDIQRLLDETASLASNQIRHRARLTKRYGEPATVRGERGALGQVFLTLLVNATQSIPEGDAEGNEIVITTRLEDSSGREVVVIEIRDSGLGMAPDVLSKVFEPYFTIKPLGEGMGLGLSISRQTISDHGGLLTVESELGHGTVFRVLLPIDRAPVAQP